MKYTQSLVIESIDFTKDGNIMEETEIQAEMTLLRREVVARFGRHPKFRLFYRAEKHRSRASAINRIESKNK